MIDPQKGGMSFKLISPFSTFKRNPTPHILVDNKLPEGGRKAPDSSVGMNAAAALAA
jgi:hypothetical protein